MGRLRKPKFSALSEQEWGYFLGLFLADGAAVRRTSKVRRRYAVDFSLQGDETDIAERLVEMLKRLELKPSMLVGQRGEYKVNVRVTSKLLVLRLPDKSRLAEDAAYRERFLECWGLFAPKVSVAFVAGLLDGDGSCNVDEYGARIGCLRGSGIGKWTWVFSQTKLPFLIDYVVRAVGSIVPNSVSVYERVKPSGRRSYDARFHKSASLALLERSIAKYSSKVASWERKIAELEKEWESKRLYTVNEVARMAKVGWHTVKKLIQNGMLKRQRREGKKEAGRVGGRRFWFFISREEANRCVRALRRANGRVEQIRREGGVSLVDTCRILGVSHDVLYRQYKTGRVRAVMVREVGRRCVSQYLMIPGREIDRLERKYGRRGGKKGGAVGEES